MTNQQLSNRQFEALSQDTARLVQLILERAPQWKILACIADLEVVATDPHFE